VPEPQEEVIRA
jgi:hypothetical protein